MKILSFFSDDQELKPVEIEMALWPGLPVIQFVGQADTALKESALRIKSAIKASGFDFPVAQQILVNLKPTHIKKTSRGIELAVALGYLWLTEQIPRSGRENEAVYVYGQLGLNGQVDEPDDLVLIHLSASCELVTGQHQRGLPCRFQRRILSHLSQAKELSQAAVIPSGNDFSAYLHRPSWLGHEFLSAAEARLFEIVAVGGHHTLLAGPSGAGKSQLARIFYRGLPDLSPAEAFDLTLQQLRAPEAIREQSPWRPQIEPHHTTPRMAMLGGGGQPQAGEIARSHLGMLILDELLEFDPEVLEGLRGPFESGEFRVGRLGGVKNFPVNSLIIATTNLCPCGDWVPGSKVQNRCRFSARRCQSYSQRLSGPLLDRFQILYFPPRKVKDRSISIESRLQEIRKVQNWQREQGGENWVLPRLRSGLELWREVDSRVQSIGFTAISLGERRRLAALRVARSLADLDFSPEIQMKHFDEAMEWSVMPFQSLNQWQSDIDH